jgi:hypothetical protein
MGQGSWINIGIGSSSIEELLNIGQEGPARREALEHSKKADHMTKAIHNQVPKLVY